MKKVIFFSNGKNIVKHYKNSIYLFYITLGFFFFFGICEFERTDVLKFKITLFDITEYLFQHTQQIMLAARLRTLRFIISRKN